MKKVHLLPNIVTAFGLSCGLFVIFKVASLPIGGVDFTNLKGLSVILLLACLADLLDGALARAMNAQSEFGGMFDSMADAITFGVGPSVVLLKSAELTPNSELSFFFTAAAMVFSVCGVLRLVRFNLMDTSFDSKKHFTGLPIPAAAAAAVSLNLFLVSPELLMWTSVPPVVRAWCCPIALVFLGYLMICRLRFLSLKTLQVRVTSFQVVFMTVLSAVLIFYGILYHFSLVFFLFSWAYVLTGMTLSVLKKITGKRVQSLADFESGSDKIDHS